MIKRYGDIISGVVILILSVIIYFNTFTFKMLTVGGVGSGFMPRLITCLMAGLAVFVILNGIKTLKKQSASDAGNASSNNKSDNLSIVVTFILIAVYIALLEKIGFVIMTSLYLFAQIYVLTQRSRRKIVLHAILSVAISATIYCVFVYVFQLLLPAGILG